jgi:hypothetical protein
MQQHRVLVRARNVKLLSLRKQTTVEAQSEKLAAKTLENQRRKENAAPKRSQPRAKIAFDNKERKKYEAAA